MAAQRATVDEYIARLYGETLRLTFPCDRFAMLRLDPAAHRWDAVREFRFT